MMSSPSLLTVALFTAALFAGGVARAQLVVSLALPKTTFVDNESIIATVKVANRSGRDLILNGPGGGTPWLGFKITNQAGTLISPTRNQVPVEPTMLRAGATITRSVNLLSHYGIDSIGSHGITASVYSPGTNSSYPSKRTRVSIAKGRKFWEQVVGVPEGQPDAGQQRRYTVLTYRDVDRQRLYAQIEDAVTGRTLVNHPLGHILQFRDPQVATDGANQLHILFMVLPRVYKHVTISPGGKILDEVDYREEGSSRPIMNMSDTGVVAIRGGLIHSKASDPLDSLSGGSASGGGAAGKTSTRPGGVRSLSDRPL